VTITWQGMHNIQETFGSDCLSGDFYYNNDHVQTLGSVRPVVGYYGTGHVQTFTSIVPGYSIVADPGTTRYFRCDLHCAMNNARFEVSCPASQSSGTGDPHLQNIHGERFDLMRPGKHVLLHIPREERVHDVLLRVDAEVRQVGGQCADMYFQDMNITGAWVEAIQTGGLRFQAQDAIDNRGWLNFGKVELKVAHGRTRQGLKYLNFYVKHLGHVGFAVGGLLGEDDHTEAAMPSEACVSHISLSSKQNHNDQSASDVSAAVGSFA